MYNKVNIRVYKRGFKSTILIWNVHPLTDEQRNNVEIQVRRQGDKDWIIPKTEMPDVQRMGRVKDEFTDTISIVHDDNIKAETAFLVRLVFGKGETDFKEATLNVEPSNTHKVFTKPERIVTATGKTVYAENAHVVSMDEGVMDRIVDKLKGALKGE